MHKMIRTLSLSMALACALPVAAFANTYVVCGTSVDADMNATDFELALSSDNASEKPYEGAVGNGWNLKLQSVDAEWLKPTKKITAETSVEGKATVVTVTIANATTPSGIVGTQYKLIDLYADEPTLEKYTIGGFVGFLKTATYKCMSSND